ncbi:MAG TPA: DNA-processing protein DprA [Mariprofundaceae bacterium]|nr:DNA-processing protein DprA [Mariprofundaceae bacterium]
MQEAATLWLRLLLARGVGPVSGRELVRACGSIEALWKTPPQALLKIDGVGPRIAEAIAGVKVAEVERIAALCRQHDISVLSSDDDGYPPLLAETNDAPLLLFVRGDPTNLQRLPMLAVVGARKASREGSLIARRWSRYFSERGVTIVSGMAYGIDAAAHGGALEGDSPTIAVLGAGLASRFTDEQQRQIVAVCRNGCVVSEFLPEMEARPEHFPRRNRIIAALSQATLVVEADVQSGSLITARFAADYGRDVFAVPGSVLGENHAGCHQLIRDGAMLAESAEQVLRELGWGDGVAAKAEYSPVSEEEKNMLQALVAGPLHVDMLAETCGLTLPQLSPILLALELQGVVERLPGSRYLLAVELRES